VEKVLLLVAGEGPGLHQATQLVVASDGFKHILATRWASRQQPGHISKM
jgi:hypothetical protein